MSDHAHIVVDGEALAIEYRWIDGGSHDAPTIVFLHEGLGSVSMWKDFPDRLCAAGGFRGLVFSRPGYGTSTPRPHDRRWRPDFMHRQARDVLPALFDALALDTTRHPSWLFGHSDGGSIALLHASMFPDRVAGVIALAPHLFVEQLSVDSIATTRDVYETTDLREKLARHHADVDSAFWGWNDIWLDPAFRDWNIGASLSAVTAPVLAIQGIDDEYGTMAQIDGIRAALPKTRLVKLTQCGHSPHRDRPEAVIDETVRFVASHAPAPTPLSIQETS